MINVGDNVSFSLEGKQAWFTGKVVIIGNYRFHIGATKSWYIDLDLNSLKDFSGSLSRLTIGSSLRQLPTSFSVISNIEDYGEHDVYILYCVENDLIKLQVSDIISSKQEDGCKCNECKHFIQYAAPNQSDNTFICYSCVSNPIRKYY